jgi:hypothetical protein
MKTGHIIEIWSEKKILIFKITDIDAKLSKHAPLKFILIQATDYTTQAMVLNHPVWNACVEM